MCSLATIVCVALCVCVCVTVCLRDCACVSHRKGLLTPDQLRCVVASAWKEFSDIDMVAVPESRAVVEALMQADEKLE